VLAAAPVAASFPGEPGKIAMARFSDGKGIWVMGRNGGGLERLTQRSDMNPSWSPNGDMLTFQRYFPSDGSFKIFVMNADGSGRRAISEPSLGTQQGCAIVEPEWSYDGAFVAYMDFCFDTDPRVAQIRVAAADGSGEVQLADYGPVYLYSQPWSPNLEEGLQLVYTGGSPSDVFRVNSDGTGVFALTNDPDLMQLEAQWSPRGDLIAFVSQPVDAEVPKGYLEVVEPDGENRRVVFEGKYSVGEPLWSPDGSKLFFTRYSYYGMPTGMILDIETDELTVVGKGYSSMPSAWSPRSDAILLGHRGNIVKYRLGSGTFVKLTSGPAQEGTPDWQAR
ncbi:MAG TPA: hypothetical protein VFS18_05815, partial [Actinomycetota bacterium]|nr:hypothetical protein [Actinomycetota bacterium]